MVRPFVVRPLLALCVFGASPAVLAAEGGVGRPITGQQVFSYAGIVPPEPGWAGKFADAQASVSARWVPELDTKNRPEGNGFSVNLTLAFF